MRDPLACYFKDMNVVDSTRCDESSSQVGQDVSSSPHTEEIPAVKQNAPHSQVMMAGSAATDGTSSTASSVLHTGVPSLAGLTRHVRWLGELMQQGVSGVTVPPGLDTPLTRTDMRRDRQYGLAAKHLEHLQSELEQLQCDSDDAAVRDVEGRSDVSSSLSPSVDELSMPTSPVYDDLVDESLGAARSRDAGSLGPHIDQSAPGGDFIVDKLDGFWSAAALCDGILLQDICHLSKRASSRSWRMQTKPFCIRCGWTLAELDDDAEHDCIQLGECSICGSKFHDSRSCFQVRLHPEWGTNE